jgi:tetrahydromethanopterin S-methyltransferase subunit G
MADETEEPKQTCCLGWPVGDADERIRRQLQVNVAYYARRLDRIEERLKDLESEWNIERTVAVGAGVATLVGLVFGLFRKKWALLPAAAAAVLIGQAADCDCCAQPPMLRCLGLRTRQEIEQERYALKALRGDFSGVAPGPDADPEASAASAIDAVQQE